ncbi:Sensor histidine kinase YpdA [BD1-7 clade bacterium]|uniref:Sensor histidine kinase YpdA n=1 Tax=BD1-7 clade bacterium TaxID=2029982 RepID=A0A5S9QF56_9GAMM|nr:Sensor histidine kinase YpdA [BD1-7 clade bacterium]CAA0115980.1 Sensor histidine kinase YpdA [BD1-7 clade bacterium]
MRDDTDETRFLLPNLCDYQALFVLITVCQFIVILDVLFQDGVHFDWTYFGLATLYVQWQAICSAALLCVLRTRLSVLPRRVAVTSAYLLLVAMALVMGLIVEWLEQPGWWFDSATMNWDFILRNFLLSTIIIGIGLRYLYVHQQLLNQQQAELRATLMALQARIRPHFLFNSLNSIASLICFAPDRAERMVEDLAALMRASLRDNVVETTIREEWILSQRYLAIEQIRIEERLQYTCDFEQLDVELPIPSLCLQPILENAIYYGIQPNPEPGMISIKGTSDNGLVEIVIDNTQIPDREAQQRSNRQSNRMAMANIRHRIERLYGESATLEMTDMGDMYRVRLCYRVEQSRR